MAKYLHGLPIFTIETDHKPLVPILNDRALVEMSPRIQRLRMKLLQFRFTATYIRGCDNVDADALSKTPVTAPTEEDEMAEREITSHINSIIQRIPATSQRLEQIRESSATDMTLLVLKETFVKGWPKRIQECPAEVQKYWNFRHDITQKDGLLLYRDRKIIPSELRKDILDKIHTGHLGMDKCKRRARDSVFWPGLNNQIEQFVRKCETCLKFAASKQKEPMLSHEGPERPWQKVSSDLFHFAGKEYVILVDQYSLWLEVYLLQPANTSSTIIAFKDSFGRHGIPEEIVSDNGPQYTSKQFRNFVKNLKITHTTSSPHYPQSNGLAEVMVKQVRKLLKKANHSQSKVYKGLLAMAILN